MGCVACWYGLGDAQRALGLQKPNRRRPKRAPLDAGYRSGVSLPRRGGDEDIPMTARSEVRFVDDGVELGAWLYLPKGDAQRCPAITMAHGYAGVKEHGITRFAEAFANAGFVVLLHDHRTFAISGGEPRQDVDPSRPVD